MSAAEAKAQIFQSDNNPAMVSGKCDVRRERSGEDVEVDRDGDVEDEERDPAADSVDDGIP